MAARRAARWLWVVAGVASGRWRAPPRPAGGPLAVVVGLPKMGTTSLRNFFHCSGWRTSHQACHGGPHCGACVEAFVARVAQLGVRKTALADQTALFREKCGDYDAFTQLDSVFLSGVDFSDHRERERASARPLV